MSDPMPPRRPTGRPTKLTDETVSKLTQAITMGATYVHACGYAGIAYSTFLDWMQKGEIAERRLQGRISDQTRTELEADPFYTFRVQIVAAEGRAALTWLTRIEQAASKGDWNADAWKLSRRYPEMYGTHKEILQHEAGETFLEIAARLARGSTKD